jgi:polyphosphate kinase
MPDTAAKPNTSASAAKARSTSTAKSSPAARSASTTSTLKKAASATSVSTASSSKKAASKKPTSKKPSSKKSDKKSQKQEQKRAYEKELSRLQRELVKLQEWVVHNNLKLCVIFEGRDAAGKGGTIKRIVDQTNPRVVRVVALPAPTERERSQWYFQRYVAHLPAAGEIVLFDRSWYNRAGVEHVMGFCTDEEYHEFLRSVPDFEDMLIRSGIVLVKYWFSVSDDEQERRFQERINNTRKRWKLSPMDLQSRARWVDYSRAKDEMFLHTDTDSSPWWVVQADHKEKARLNCISHLLSVIPYEDLTSAPLALPDRQQDEYVRPPEDIQRFVPDLY